MANRQVNFDASSRNFSEIQTPNSWIQLSNLVLLDLGQLEEVKDSSDLLFDLQFLPGLVEKVDQFIISANLKYLHEPYLKNKTLHTLQVDFLKNLTHLILNCRIACSIWHNSKLLNQIPILARDTRNAFKYLVTVRKEIEVTIANSNSDLKTRPVSFLSVHPQIIRTKLLTRESSGTSHCTDSTHSTLSTQSSDQSSNQPFCNLNRAFSPTKWERKDDIPDIRPEDSISRKGSRERIHVNLHSDNIDMIVTEPEEEMKGWEQNQPNIQILSDEGYGDDDNESFVISEMSDALIEKALNNRIDPDDLINFVRTYQPKSQLSLQREGVESGFQTPKSQQLSRQSSQVQLRELGVNLTPDFIDPDIEFQILYGKNVQVDRISVKDATICKWALSRIAQEWAFEPVEHLLSLFNLSIDPQSQSQKINQVLENIVLHISPMLALMETLGHIYESPDLTSINSDDTDFDLCREFFIRREAIYSELYDVFNLCDDISIQDSKENRQSLTIFVIGTIKSYEELIMVFRCLTRNKSMMEVTCNMMDDFSKLNDTKITIEVTQLKEAMNYLVGMNDLKREQDAHGNDPDYIKSLIENTPNYLDDSIMSTGSISNSLDPSLLTKQSTEFSPNMNGLESTTDQSIDNEPIEDNSELYELPILEGEEVDIHIENQDFVSNLRQVRGSDLILEDTAHIKRLSTETYKPSEKTPLAEKRNSTMTLASEKTAFHVNDERPIEGLDAILNEDRQISRVLSDPTNDFSLLETPNVEDIKNTIGKALEGVRNQHTSLPVKSKGVMIDPTSGKEFRPSELNIEPLSAKLPKLSEFHPIDLGQVDDFSQSYREETIQASELKERLTKSNNEIENIKRDLTPGHELSNIYEPSDLMKEKDFPLIRSRNTNQATASQVCQSFSSPPIGLVDKIFWNKTEKRRNSFSKYYDTVDGTRYKMDQTKELINRIKQKIDLDPNDDFTISHSLAQSKVQLWLQSMQHDRLDSMSFPELKDQGKPEAGQFQKSMRMNDDNGDENTSSGLIQKITEFLNSTGDCLLKICSSLPNIRETIENSSFPDTRTNECTIISKAIIKRRHSFSTISGETSSSSNFLFYYMGRWLNLNWLRLRLLGSYSDYTTWETIKELNTSSSMIPSQSLDPIVRNRTQPQPYCEGFDEILPKSIDETDIKSNVAKIPSLAKEGNLENLDEDLSNFSDHPTEDSTTSKYNDLFEIDDDDLFEDGLPAPVKIASFISSSSSDVCEVADKPKESIVSNKAPSRFLFKKLSFKELPPITAGSGLEDLVQMIFSSEDISQILNSSNISKDIKESEDTKKTPIQPLDMKPKVSSTKKIDLKIKPSIPRFRVSSSPRTLKSFDLKLSPGLLSPYSTYKFCSDLSTKSPSSVNSIESKFNSPSTNSHISKHDDDQYNVISSSDQVETVPMEKITTLSSLMDYKIDILSNIEPSDEEDYSVKSLLLSEEITKKIEDEFDSISPKLVNPTSKFVPESSLDELEANEYLDSSDEENEAYIQNYSSDSLDETCQFENADTDDEAEMQDYDTDSSEEYRYQIEADEDDNNTLDSYQYQPQIHSNFGPDYYYNMTNHPELYQEPREIHEYSPQYSSPQITRHFDSPSNRLLHPSRNINDPRRFDPQIPSPSHSDHMNTRPLSNQSFVRETSIRSGNSNHTIPKRAQIENVVSDDILKQRSSNSNNDHLSFSDSQSISANLKSMKSESQDLHDNLSFLDTHDFEQESDFNSAGRFQVSKLREVSSFESSNMHSVVSTSISDAQLTTTTSDDSPKQSGSTELKIVKSAILEFQGKDASCKSSLLSSDHEKLSDESIAETLNKLSEKSLVQEIAQNGNLTLLDEVTSSLTPDASLPQQIKSPNENQMNKDDTKDKTQEANNDLKNDNENQILSNSDLVSSPKHSIHSKRLSSQSKEKDGRNSVDMKSSKHNSLNSVKMEEPKGLEVTDAKINDDKEITGENTQKKRLSNKDESPTKTLTEDKKSPNDENKEAESKANKNANEQNPLSLTATENPQNEPSSNISDIKVKPIGSATFPPPNASKRKQPMSKIRSLLKFRKVEGEDSGRALTYIAPHGAEFKAGQPIPPNPHYVRRNTIGTGQSTRSNTSPGISNSKPTIQTAETTSQPKPITIKKSESTGPSLTPTLPPNNQNDNNGDGSKTPPIDKKPNPKRMSDAASVPPDVTEKWYLGYNYNSDDIVFKEGLIFSSTIEALIERLTVHNSSVDSNLIKTFMLTYRAFCKPEDFLDLLISRFNLKAPPILSEDEFNDWKSKKQSLVRIRVNNILKTWLESYFYEQDDGGCIDKMIDFAKNDMIPELPAAGQRIFGLAEELSIKLKQSQTAAKLTKSKNMDLLAAAALAKLPNIPPPLPEIPKNVAKALLNQDPFRIIDLTPMEIARQLTIMDCRHFCGIRPHELIGLEFSKKNSSSVYYVRMMTDATNEITSLICGSVLKELNIKKRAKLIQFFIEIGEECLTLRNYNSLMPIVGALSCAMLSRLKKTWALLPPRSTQVLEALRKCINHTKNYADYRNNLKKTFPPCIPFLGIYLTDLTFTDEGNEAIKKEGDKKLVNFAKYYRIVKIIEEIQKFQAPYNLIEVVELQQRLKTWMQVANQCWNEDEFYKRSLLLEPRDPNQQPITQNLASKSTISPITMQETEIPPVSLAYF